MHHPAHILLHAQLLAFSTPLSQSNPHKLPFTSSPAHSPASQNTPLTACIPSRAKFHYILIIMSSLFASKQVADIPNTPPLSTTHLIFCTCITSLAPALHLLHLHYISCTCITLSSSLAHPHLRVSLLLLPLESAQGTEARQIQSPLLQICSNAQIPFSTSHSIHRSIAQVSSHPHSPLPYITIPSTLNTKIPLPHHLHKILL